MWQNGYMYHIVKTIRILYQNDRLDVTILVVVKLWRLGSVTNLTLSKHHNLIIKLIARMWRSFWWWNYGVQRMSHLWHVSICHNISITRIVTSWRSFWYKYLVILRMWQKWRLCHMVYFQLLCVTWHFVTLILVWKVFGWDEMITGRCHHFWNRCDIGWSRGVRCNYDAGYIQWHFPSDKKCW